MMFIRSLIIATGLAVPVLWPHPAPAQNPPAPQTVLSRGASSLARPTPLPRLQHGVFGTIVLLHPTTFTLRTRAGRMLLVDFAEPLRSGMYSAPLFVGKAVLVEGSFDRRGTFDALTVTRITRLENGTPQDH